MSRLREGEFDAALADYRLGPSILQQYLLWYSKGPNSWGGFTSLAVDTALERIRTARDDISYKAGVVAFQRAVIDDPPAVFLAWGERIRAVGTRFDVHSEPGRDILSASLLRLWRPVADGRVISPN